ncbi:MAG: ribosome small subunit-dependent GTPase A [Cyclobacteriaceae bacterium]|nr:ribosome small subunit-dependent GTPase A [Cyclobacteriaceae bacterium]
MRGLVKKSTGSWYEVMDASGSTIACRVRGKMRLKGVDTTNPIAVGDEVEYHIEGDDGIISKIFPRTNYIIRQSVKKSSQAHIIASNIDQVVILATMASPRTSAGFIDRVLVAAEGFRIPQVLLFNKQDIVDEESSEIQTSMISIYEAIGVKCMKITALNEDSLLEVKKLLSGKTSLLTGHSGVGKSTLLNSIAPDINQKTSQISDFADKGVHTTTFAEMFVIKPDIKIIDTPGIKEFGLIDIESHELSDYFPEMREISDQCKFHNCQHLHEPKCAIKDAVEEGAIALSRYKSYISMLENSDNRR